MPAKPGDVNQCCCCGRTCELTFHHLIPKKVHRRQFFKNRYNKEQLSEGIWVCRQCHNGIHKQYDEMTLAKKLNTLKLLREQPELEKHFSWVSKQKIQPSEQN
jgi:hypothetical protein